MSKVTFKGAEVKIAGSKVKVGDNAPEVTLVSKDLEEVKVGGHTDFIQVLVAVPSLDTGVCAAEARKFNEKASAFKNVKLSVISMDLPFAMGRFCTTEGIENVQSLSDFRHKSFAKEYGILIDNTVLSGLTARAVFIVKDGKIAYEEIVSEITNEPNYEAIEKEIKKLSGDCCCCCH